MIYDKDTVCLPRQGIPFCLRPLYLLDFRKFRAGSWDTFGTVEDCDIAQNSRCRLLMKEPAPAVAIWIQLLKISIPRAVSMTMPR